MNILTIVRKNLQKRFLSTALTVLSVTLGAALVIAVQVLVHETEQTYHQTSVGYDLILAAPGSRMQTTLNTIYHLETSTGIIPFGVYSVLKDDPRVDKVFPFYVGDSYRGYRIIGTTRDFLLEAEPRAGQRFEVKEGRVFENPFEAVAGYLVARDAGIAVGDTVYFTHGIAEPAPGVEEYVHEDEPVIITGILERTATANDRVIFTSVFTTHAVHDHTHHHGHVEPGHDDHHHHHHHHDHDHDHHYHEVQDEKSPAEMLAELESSVKELDAVLVKLDNQALAMNIAGMLNYPTPANPLLLRNLQRDPLFQYKDDLMGVIPAMQIKELMDIVGNAGEVLRSIGILVFFVALMGILVSIYNTMEERKRDIAIMRSLGAGRNTILTLILLEAAFITIIGCILGWVAGQATVQAVSPMIADAAGVVVSGFVYDAEQIRTLAVFTILGIISGLIPAFKAYRTDVVRNLSS